MLEEILKVAIFIQNSIIHVWPYLLISVPLAVVVRMSGASKYIGKVFNKKPLLSILLATIIGAFSPFCSCSVIPIIASLLIGGVPLAPVMSFWLASPSMDPEIFFLSVSVLGWQLAVWRLASAFGMSFFSGLITHYLVKKGWIKEDATLKAHSYSPAKSNRLTIKESFVWLKDKYLFIEKRLAFAGNVNPVADKCSCNANEKLFYNYESCDALETNRCACSGSEVTVTLNQALIKKDVNSCCNLNPVKYESKNTKGQCCAGTPSDNTNKKSFYNKLLKETFSATSMVLKFMILAYFLEALIVLYVPGQFITMILGQNHILSIIMASLIGIPIYTSSMPALALVAGLMSKGMIPAAGLSFLISGPTTTIPAMAAVWNLANRKVFFLYVGFTLAFAVISGLLLYVTSLL
jgi:uncharacterized protein